MCPALRRLCARERGDSLALHVVQRDVVQLATCSPLWFGRVLPRMMGISVVRSLLMLFVVSGSQRDAAAVIPAGDPASCQDARGDCMWARPVAVSP